MCDRVILPLKFPIFCKYRCANDARGRWRFNAYQVPIKIGETKIYPGDYVFGDADGVVVVPKDLTVKVLEKAEKQVEKENEIRDGLRKGGKLYDLYITSKHRE